MPSVQAGSVTRKLVTVPRPPGTSSPAAAQSSASTHSHYSISRAITSYANVGSSHPLQVGLTGYPHTYNLFVKHLYRVQHNVWMYFYFGTKRFVYNRLGENKAARYHTIPVVRHDNRGLQGKHDLCWIASNDNVHETWQLRHRSRLTI